MTLLEQLNIKHPIFLAPMAGVSTPELAAEVSNQGGLGSLGLGANTVDAAREQILRTQELTDFPFQTNFFCHGKSVFRCVYRFLTSRNNRNSSLYHGISCF